ncbi:UDP-2,4-diacetamido-2,4,6-trideoxy-beta-L-altropyranose hydrolase [Aliidongia dinghuensis]|uniref:UDP-2,4-diacetamido-2,4,6-trideoxy-beta-L-altropyranose hydrolase n=1 Tax=Aliidongia dinghuensis TaxID=1867774 RepID=A0A8J2YVL2_9PROT|nr:UDP-2,4-diacetamido-2,4,6-trideoxy-beta-L-altropyranose hydrolase [Aliidongia dinghuensis]GGF24141.1 UDP-2,4-diacetamido-2,4,6-trideoxy-beta-L-altropyranose hydrolase [Aliidongia dinghuensis]
MSPKILQPLILFRADATPAMGTGHVMRCLALAEALRDRAIDVAFVAAALTPSIAHRLAAERIDVHPAGDPDDAAATIALGRTLGANALVVDGYHFSAAWRQAVRSLGVPILAFQDLDDGAPLHADLVLNAAARPEETKWRRAAPAATFLTGPRYVLLRRELRRAVAAPKRPVAARSALLVTFGGADPTGLTLPVTAALAGVLGPEATLDVVIGGSVPNGAGLVDRVAALDPRVSVHLDPIEMAPLMGRAGLAVSAAGGTIGELAALGVPALIAIVAENQVAGAAASAAAGWCEAVDARASGAVATLAARAAALWADAPLRQAMADRTAGLIDAGGVDRVADALVSAMQTLW